VHAVEKCTLAVSLRKMVFLSCIVQIPVKQCITINCRLHAHHRSTYLYEVTGSFYTECRILFCRQTLCQPRGAIYNASSDKM